MERVAISARFEGEAAEPSGEPPQTNPRATSVPIDAVTAAGSPIDIGRASYQNHVTFTGESAFTETGTLTFGEGEGELDVVPASAGAPHDTGSICP
jgi:hypothetical protein